MNDSGSAASSVRCACGATEITAVALKVTSLRCGLCPKDDPPKPVLRLVKS